ncbi:hypothetical protein D4764_03G0006150, partial [Takifugu flavidus]
HPVIDFPREAEECDPPIVGTHPLVPTLKNRDHQPGLPVQGHCPRCRHNVAEACQPGQPYNIQSLKIPRVDVIRSRSSAAGQQFRYLSNFRFGNWMVYLLVIRLCSTLRIRVASLNSSHARVFASATVAAATRLANLYRLTAPLTTGLGATARERRLDNGRVERGPFRLNVPYRPQNTIKALSECPKHMAADQLTLLIGQTVPPNHAFPGHAAVDHVSVEVSQQHD